LLGLQEAIQDELLPQEELLTAEDFSPLTMPTMQIAQAFQTQLSGAAEVITQTDSIVDEVDLSQTLP
jgi:hypothetical protein